MGHLFFWPEHWNAKKKKKCANHFGGCKITPTQAFKDNTEFVEKKKKHGALQLAPLQK